MAQPLDIPCLLLDSKGDTHPCKLINISEKGYIELYSLDEVDVGSRFQLVMNKPNVRTGITLTAVEYNGDAYLAEGIPEMKATDIQGKIVEQKVRGLLD